MTYYVHNVPGRLRVKIPVLKNNPDKALEIRRILKIEGIADIRENAVTGSVVIAYRQDRLQAADILNILQAHGLFDRNRAVDSDTHISAVAHKTTARLGRALVGWAVGRALESNGLSLLAAFI